MSIDERVLREAKRISADTGRKLASVLEELLREPIARLRLRGAALPVTLPTFHGNGPRPGVDLDHSADLLDRMEDPGASR